MKYLKSILNRNWIKKIHKNINNRVIKNIFICIGVVLSVVFSVNTYIITKNLDLYDKYIILSQEFIKSDNGVICRSHSLRPITSFNLWHSENDFYQLRNHSWASMNLDGKLTVPLGTKTRRSHFLWLWQEESLTDSDSYSSAGSMILYYQASNNPRYHFDQKIFCNQAIGYFEIALTLKPKNPGLIYLKMAQSYYYSNQKEKSIKFILKSLESSTPCAIFYFRDFIEDKEMTSYFMRDVEVFTKLKQIDYDACQRELLTRSN